MICCIPTSRSWIDGVDKRVAVAVAYVGQGWLVDVSGSLDHNQVNQSRTIEGLMASCFSFIGMTE
jgi:hypothetical protein